MKKSLFILLMLFALTTSAQKHVSAVFDFTKPLALTPSVTPSNEVAGITQVSDVTFKQGQATISFAKGAQPTGSMIVTLKDVVTSATHYALRVTSTTTMSFGALDGATIDSIRVSNESILGDLHLVVGDPGYQDPYQEYKFWKADKNVPVTKVSFYNSSAIADLEQVTVYYTTPSDILVPESDIEEGSTIPQFTALNLTFKSKMTLAAVTGLKLVDAEGKEYEVAASVNGNVLTITSKEPLTKDGDFTLTVPARLVKNAEGYENEELVYHFKVYEPRDTFNPINVTADPIKTKSLLNPITLLFDGQVGFVSKDALVMKKNGQIFKPVVATFNANEVALQIENVGESITEEGIYTVTIPEGFVHSEWYGYDNLREMYDRWNEEITLAYIVGEEEPTPPGDDNDDTNDSDTMKLAKELLTNTGAGYPKTDSEAYKQLEELVKAETTPTDEALDAAIEAFYAEKNVALPATDAFYTIANVNSKGEKLYLAYANGSVTLTDEEIKAATFKATTTAAGKVYFTTPDNKYFLHVLADQANYESTNADNVLAIYDAAINDLTLARFVGNDAKATFGLMTIFGSLGKNKNTELEASVYAAVSHKSKAVVSDPTFPSILFSEDISMAFAIQESVLITPDVVNIEATLSSKELPSKGTVQLTLKTDAALELAEKAKVALVDAEGKEVKVDIAATHIKNVFDVITLNAPDGEYELVIPEGTFTFEQAEKAAVNAEIRIGVRIGALPAAEDFQYELRTWNCNNDPNSRIADTSLNDLIVFIDRNFSVTEVNVPGATPGAKPVLDHYDVTVQQRYSDLIPDESMTVNLARYNDGKLITKGHFERIADEDLPDYLKQKVYATYNGQNICFKNGKYVNLENGYEPIWMYNVIAIRLVLDEPIEAGSLENDQYTFVIEKATFGDAKFGLFLQGDPSVQRHDCIVNPKMTLTFTVEKTSNVEIEGIVGGEAEGEVFDISGRRVNNSSRPGLYIKNGKKVFVK